MSYWLLLLLAAPPAAAAPAPIVVTGQRLVDTEAALRACLARSCPPDEDIDASLAHAENLFVAGRYEDSRKVVRASIARNRRHGRAYPVPVSDLYRANGRIAAHLGLDGDYARSTWAILETLKAGVPAGDHRLFEAQMEIAAMTARLRGYEAAKHVYDRLAGEAERAGRRDVAAIARVRSAWMAYSGAPSEDLRRPIERMAQVQDPELVVASRTAKLFLSRIARERGRNDEADRLLGEAAGTRSASPILVYSPPYELNVQEVGDAVPASAAALAASGNPARRYGGNFDGMWIDVGFWVQPDGGVAEVEVMRRHGDSAWADPLLASIRGRRYSAGGAPVYRLERYTYTSGWETQTGTHLQRRSPRARVEYLDLGGSAPPA